MHGPEVQDAGQVRMLWNQWCGNKFKQEPQQVGETVMAYVSDGRWVATCPNCNGGMATWIEMEDCCCYDCGNSYLVSFPSPSVVAEAEMVLEARPQSARNWVPEAETLLDLKVENLTRGIPITGEVI